MFPLKKVQKLSLEQIEEELKVLPSAWKLEESHVLVRIFSFKDFKGALAFTNQIGVIAERAQHHPDIVLTYGKVEIKIFTHSVKGLTQKDFILAKEIESEYSTFI